MIPGITAAARRRVAGGGIPNPISGSIINLDFLAGLYWLGSTQVTAADIFNETLTLDAGGVDCSSGPISLKGDALAAVLGQRYFTVIAEYTYVRSQVGYECPIVAYDLPSYNSGWEIYGSDTVINADEYGTTGSLATYWDAEAATGSLYVPLTSRVAVSYQTGRVAVSVNGYPVVGTNGTNADIHPNSVQIGYDTGNGNGLHVREIVMLPLQTESDLPTLSTIT